MGDTSAIQWTDATWNPWHGCKKVSEGCKYCYMYRDKERYGQDPTTVLKSKTNFNAPLKWKDGKLIFTCSWSDWFIEEADTWRPGAWEIIKNTPHHTYQILTKRPERIADSLPADWGDGYPNVWLGVSIESDKVAYERLWKLISTPAKIKFVSAEPLISSVDFLFDKCLTGNLLEHGIDWVIIGGESGNDIGNYKFRPCELAWIEDIIQQCRKADKKVFVKQLGTYLSKKMKLKDSHGGNIDEWPEHLRIREMPV